MDNLLKSAGTASASMGVPATLKKAAADNKLVDIYVLGRENPTTGYLEGINEEEGYYILKVDNRLGSHTVIVYKSFVTQVFIRG